MTGVHVEGYQEKEDENMGVDENLVGPGFFATMGIPLLTGRDFTRADQAGAPLVAVVNENFVKRYLPGQDPIGHRIWLRGGKERPIAIVGVVKDGKHWGLREDPKRFLYLPAAQQSVFRMTFYARTRQDPAAVATMLRREVQRLDPNLPIYDVQTLNQQIDESIFTDRIVAVLSVAFGALATLLAAIGLYGVMAYMVVRRTREIGVRMALGASRREVLGLVMREVALVMGVGIAIALACSYALGRVIGSQLYGVSGNDPAVIGAATLGLALVAGLAGFIPASRAARVDPLVALRYE
jgi:predicted permease